MNECIFKHVLIYFVALNTSTRLELVNWANAKPAFEHVTKIVLKNQQN